MTIKYARKSLPVLRSGDVVIGGGSLAGVAAALKLAKAGLKVILVEPRTYLGREISAVLAPWITADKVHSRGLIAGLVQAAQKGEERAGEQEVALHMDEVKRYLEDRILEAGVQILYASQPVGLIQDENGITGLVVGNKSGRQIIEGKVFIDATETALLARLAGMALEPVNNRCWGRNMEFDNLGAREPGKIQAPEEFGLVDNSLLLHRGYRKSHGVIECRFQLPNMQEGLRDMTRAEIETRERLMRLASWLVHNVPGFEKAYLGNVAYELDGLYTGRLAVGSPDWMNGKNIPSLLPYATETPLIWMLNPASRTEDPCSWNDPIKAGEAGERLGTALATHWHSVITSRGASLAVVADANADDKLTIHEPVSPQRGQKYAFRTAPRATIPVLADMDVLVVGGGTSGAVAAYAAASEKASTFVVEMLPGLGGTGTYGGVHSYWCGYRGGFVAKVRRWVNESQKDLGLHGLSGYIPVWNMDSKAYALEKHLRLKGVQFLYNAKVIGAVMDGNKLRGVVAATRLGPVCILGKVIVDASGDGDVAAFAGADFVFGSQRDHMVMWFSLPQFFKPGRNRNNFSSPVDISNIEDFNRALISGRRRGKVGEDHDHGIYLATRESRHIVGDVMPTLTDHLLHRAWEDVISFAFSNNDIKGQIYSEWFRIGLIPPHLEIEIPYRALLPKGLENIIVVGKAVSTTHDALPAIRMQPDFENLGGAGGLAAALAVSSGTTARAVNMHKLQERVAKYKVLSPKFIKRRLTLLKFTKEELSRLVRSLSAEKPLYTYSDMALSKIFEERIPFVDIVTAGPQVIPLLESELERETDPKRRVLLAQALALVGSKAGVPILVETLMNLLAGDQLPERDFILRQVDRFSPDQAAMPAAGYLLFSLAEARDHRAIPVWERVVDLLAQAKQEDIWSQRKGTFYYVDAVCTGAEKLADPAAVPLLLRLAAYTPFHQKQLTSGFQADYLLERPAYLEVVIARALARCTSPEGVVTLINYLQDVRALLAEQAHSELIAISGQDFGKDPSAWSQWLEQNEGSLQPVPWTAPSDAIASWSETVYISEPEEE